MYPAKNVILQISKNNQIGQKKNHITKI